MIAKYFSLFSAFIYLIFALILFLRKSPIKRANIRLALIFLVLALCTSSLLYKYIACQSQSFSLLRLYIPVDAAFFMLIGPSVYLYVSEIFGKRQQFWSVPTLLVFLSLLPSLLYAIYYMPLSTQERVDILLQNTIKLSWQQKGVIGFFFAQMIGYFIYCYWFIKKQVSRSQNIHIGLVVIDMSWLQTFFLFDIVLMVTCSVISVYFESDYSVDIVGLTILNIQCIYIFTMSLWQTGVFKEDMVPAHQSPNEPKVQFVEPVTLSHEEDSPLLVSIEVADRYISILQNSIYEKKLYLQPNCSLQDVAHLTHISVHHISNVINCRLHKSFPDFMNEFRIEAAKLMLKDPTLRHLTIETIAHNCGFGSKANFNNSFKKHTQFTPTEYQKNLNL